MAAPKNGIKPSAKHHLVSGVAALLILIFSYTAFSKLWDLPKFERALATTPIVQTHYGIFARLIPGVELLIVLLLLLPALRWWGLASSFVLLSLFTAYVAGMMLWAPELPCSCGGIIQQLSWRQHLGLNMILTGLSLGALLIDSKRTIAIDRGSRKPEVRVGTYFSTKNVSK